MEKMINIKIKRIENGKLPEYKTSGASGADCFARINEQIIIKPRERKLIPLGFAVEIPEGFEMQIRPRSGNANKYGITILNTPGTIDSDYRGEVHANIFNSDEEKSFMINPGDRIAQAVICPIYQADWNEVDKLSETDRGSNGHGSTGVR